MPKKGKQHFRKAPRSLPYIIIAVFVSLLSLAGAYFLWQFVRANLQYFTAERLSYFVLITGVIGSILLFRALYLLAISKSEAHRRTVAIQNQLNTTVLNNIGEGIVATDNDERVFFMNDVMYSMLGLKGDVKEMPFHEAVTIQDEKGRQISAKRDPIRGAIRERKRVATTVAETDYYFVRSDNTKFPVVFTATPVMSNGDTVGAVLVVRDVTKEKEIDQAKNEFVSLASHQLRTPLSAMRWYVEALLNERTGSLNDEQKKYLKFVYEGGERMSDLVNALLNVSRIELGTFAIEPEMTKLQDVAESVFHELEPMIQEKKVNITKRYDDNLGELSVDPNLTRIIFQNLLSNAVKYTPEKGTVTIVLEKRDPNALIVVSDTGYGIPKSEQKEIFGKMFRAQNVKEKEVSGNGLGLYIVKSILDHSGGKIWFESPANSEFKSEKVENPGTTFYVTIPLSGMKGKEGSRKLNLRTNA